MDMIGPIFALAFWAVAVRLISGLVLTRRRKRQNAVMADLLAAAPREAAMSVAICGRRALVARRCGLVFGMAAAILVQGVFVSPSVFIAPVVVAGGYMAGIIVGESTMPGPVWSGAERTTGLRPRLVGDYLRSWVRCLVPLAAVCGIAVCGYAIVRGTGNGDSLTQVCTGVNGDTFHLDTEFTVQNGVGVVQPDGTVVAHMTGSPWPGVLYAGPLIAAFLIGPLATEWALRRVATRPRPAADSVLAEVDDALRRESSRRIVAGGLAWVVFPLAGLLYGMGLDLQTICDGIVGPDLHGAWMVHAAEIGAAVVLFFLIVYPSLVRLEHTTEAVPEPVVT
jgi:hypothetical protein